MEHSTNSAASHLPTWQDDKTTHEKRCLQSDHELSAHLRILEQGQGLDAQLAARDGMDLRQIFTNRVMPVAFALPWIASMLISWIPFTKISISNAPDFLYV
jgi:hypothetical protein